MKLSIIIPHHNGKKLLFDCLESLFDNISIDSFEVIVVDNHSNDGSAAVSYTHLRAHET